MEEQQAERIERGVLHGRFQVLHRDHLAYLLKGKSLCNHLIVAITNPDPVLTRADGADPGRSDVMANPLTYYERYVMVRTALEAAGIRTADFSVVPLPINIPELYRYYVPLDAVFFLSIYDAWGKKKLQIFRSLELKTHIIRNVKPDEKGISGSNIRTRMRSGEPWENLVPPGVARLMKEWKIPRRLRDMCSRE